MRIVQGLGQHGDFLALLHGKGQPAFQFGIELVFPAEVHRAVQQRTGAGHPEVGTKALLGLLQLLQRLVQVTAPDVAAVDHTQGQHFIGG
ncbi:hypothetical protein D3C80_919940 [compost metagenome]